jgi:hypothetical protein
MLMAEKGIVVSGVQIGPKSDLVDMFRRALQGETVFPSKTAFGPEDGVVRVLGATQGSDLETQARKAIMQLLTDRDARVRAGAVMALGTYPHGFDGRVILQILERQPQLFRGVAPLAQAYPDLEWELLIAIDATHLKDPKFTERLKAAVTDPSNGGWVVGSVTKADPGWVLGHARDVVAGQASRVNGVLANLDDPQEREEFLKSLRGEPEEFRKDAAARLDRVVGDPQQRERLTSLLLQ